MFQKNKTIRDLNVTSRHKMFLTSDFKTSLLKTNKEDKKFSLPKLDEPKLYCLRAFLLKMFSSVTGVLSILALLPILFCSTCQNNCNCQLSCNICKTGHVTTLCLKNKSYYQMGFDYGTSLREELDYTLKVLIQYYQSVNVSYESLVDEAEKFYQRYISINYRNFIAGLSHGSGLILNDVKILNGMETLQSLSFSCAFAYIPPKMSATKLGIIARNYDYPQPFDIIAGKNLIVTIIDDLVHVPTTIIGMPGQIYCPSCLNAANIFVELNNGEASGGSGAKEDRKTMLIKLLEFLQESNDLKVLKKKLIATQSDYSLIINIADHRQSSSYEYSVANGVKPFVPYNNKTFISTNFFLNSSWNLPPPRDRETWFGVTRRKNLKRLFTRSTCDISCVKNAMDVKLENGGALWLMTIYQMIYDTSTYQLFIRAPQFNWTWNTINLSEFYFKTNVDSSQFNKLLILVLICVVLTLVTLGNIIVLRRQPILIYLFALSVHTFVIFVCN